jgi:GNAT superfamily N-acetyltransferase
MALRMQDRALVGGLYGATMWGWLMIDGLWVADELRGRGLGRRRLLAAESAAVERGCRGAWLGTFGTSKHAEGGRSEADRSNTS